VSRPLRILLASILLVAFLGATALVSRWDDERELRLPVPASVTALAFEPRGGLLLAASDEERLQVLSPSRRTVVREIGEPGEGSVDLAFGGGGKLLATASVDSKVRVRRWPSGELVATIDAPGVVGVAFTHKGGLVTGRRDFRGAIRIETRTTPSSEPQEPFALWRAKTIRLSPDGELVAFFVEDGDVYVFSIESGERAAKARDLRAPRIENEEEYVEPPPVQGVGYAWNGRGDLLAISAVSSSGVALISPYEDRGPPPDPFEIPRWPGLTLESGGGPCALSWDGKLLVAGRTGEAFSVPSMQKLQKGAALAPTEHFTAIAISRSGVAAGALGKEIVLWRVGTPR